MRFKVSLGLDNLSVRAKAMIESERRVKVTESARLCCHCHRATNTAKASQMSWLLESPCLKPKYSASLLVTFAREIWSRTPLTARYAPKPIGDASVVMTACGPSSDGIMFTHLVGFASTALANWGAKGEHGSDDWCKTSPPSPCCLSSLGVDALQRRMRSRLIWSGGRIEHASCPPCAGKDPGQPCSFTRCSAQLLDGAMPLRHPQAG